MQTYTPQQGNTPQGQQVADSQNILTTAAANPANLPSTQQLGQQATQATNNLVQTQTPDSRASYVNATGYNNIQSNYEDLAKQLFKTDQMQLAPQYQQAPTVAPDALSYGRVGASSLQQLTPDAAAAPTTLFADNPKYAMASMAQHNSNILDLLGTLNSALAKEADTAKGRYANTVQSQQSLLDSIFKAIGIKSQMDAQKKEEQKGQVVQTDQGTLLINPVTGETIKKIGGPKLGTKESDVNLKQELANDVSNHTTLADAMKKYTAKGLDPDEIAGIYQINSPKDWGNIQETSKDLQQKFKISKQVADSIGSDAGSTSNKAAHWQYKIEKPPSVLGISIGANKEFLFNPADGTTLPIVNNTITLKDPDSGQAHNWRSGDPEIQQALEAGWKP